MKLLAVITEPHVVDLILSSAGHRPGLSPLGILDGSRHDVGAIYRGDTETSRRQRGGQAAVKS